VRKYGGVINVDSKIGEGTTFKISLPLKPEQPQQQPKAAAQS